MPKLEKLFTLEVTVEQFLRACSETELQEVDLLLAGELRRREVSADRKKRMELWRKTQNEL